MSQGDKWDAKKVQPLAEKIAEAVSPGCERIEIAGSLRRKKKLVGDIELVLVEKVGTMASGDLFGTTRRVSLLTPILDQLVTEGRLSIDENGPSYKRFRLAKVARPLYVDMFIVDPVGWGFQLAIRTGPSWFSQKLVTERARGGYLRDGFKCAGGRVWELRGELDPPADGSAPPDPYALFDGSVYERYPVPEESDFMKLQSCGDIPPEKRRNP